MRAMPEPQIGLSWPFDMFMPGSRLAATYPSLDHGLFDSTHSQLPRKVLKRT